VLVSPPLRRSRAVARLVFPLALVALAALLPAAAGAAVRVGTAPAIPAAAEPAGTLSPERQLHLVVGLEPSDPEALAGFAESVSTPGSADFREYVGSAEFASRFAPGEAQIAKVRASLEAAGLEVGTPPADHLLLPVSGSVAAVEAAFSTPLEKVELPSGRLAYANLQAPAIASAAAPYVAGVSGLEDLQRFEPHLAAEPRVSSGGPQPCKESPHNAWWANEIAINYGFNGLYQAGDFGAGQTVALFELAPYRPSDVAKYQACYGTAAAIENVEVEGGAPGGEPDGEAEATLDVEQIVGLAPQAHVRVYNGPNTGAGRLALLSKIMSENVAKSISTSWGLCEHAEERPLYVLENNLLEEAAAQGQSFFAASGDSGSEDCYDEKQTGLAVDNPSSQPFATGVGGTRLENPENHLETIWNNGDEGGGGGGGGGVSSIWPMPSYQSSAAPGLGVVSSSSGSQCGASLCREVPDVSADADPHRGYEIYFGGKWIPVGGTSAAAPLWAAFAALANASPGCVSRPVGFVNPALYAIGSTAYAANLRDVTAAAPNGFATNDILFEGTRPYPVTPGYDMASGLGTPIGASLANSLCGLAGPAFKVAVTYPGPQQGTVGSPAALQIVASQSAGRELAYAASGLPAGLAINPTNGFISGTPTAAVTSTATVFATDPFGNVASTEFTWTVVPSLRVVRAKLTGLAKGRPRLSFKLAAATGAALTAVRLKVPEGLQMNRSVRVIDKHVKVKNAKKKTLGSKSKPVWKGLQVTLRKAATSASFVVPFPALLADAKLIKQARGHKVKKLQLALTVTETTGTKRPLALPLEPH
jgi:subtilase family serine protease